MKTYTRISPTEIGIIDDTPKVISLADLKRQEQTYLDGIADCEAKLIVIREKMAEADRLGVVEAVEPEAEPVGEEPVIE